MSQNIYIYTDASFHKESGQAVLGYAYLSFENDLLTAENINLIQVEALNNIRAEIRSALLALENSPEHLNITVYTDCSTTSGLLERREKLETNNYISKAKGKVIRNADLYKRFYKVYDRLQPKIVWVKGHTRKNEQSLVNKNFALLDKMVRAKLRSVI